VLAKIHTSVRSLGGRLEEIEHTRSRKVKSYKKKLIKAMEKYREIEERCRRAEGGLQHSPIKYQEVNFTQGERYQSQVSSKS
jgi:hypothetical protein